MSTRSENDVRRPEPRDRLIQPGQVRHASAQHDDVGIQDVHDSRQGARHPVLVARQRGLRGRVARGRAAHQLGHGAALARRALVVGATARDRTGTSRCTPSCRSNTAGPGHSPSRGQGSGLWPHSPATALGPTSTRPVHRDARRPSPSPRSRRTRRARRARRRPSPPTGRSSSRRWPAGPGGRGARPGRGRGRGR